MPFIPNYKTSTKQDSHKAVGSGTGGRKESVRVGPHPRVVNNFLKRQPVGGVVAEEL